jgi:hypothetical protein
MNSSIIIIIIKQETVILMMMMETEQMHVIYLYLNRNSDAAYLFYEHGNESAVEAIIKL